MDKGRLRHVGILKIQGRILTPLDAGMGASKHFHIGKGWQNFFPEIQNVRMPSLSLIP
jgi:hypothetical protein